MNRKNTLTAPLPLFDTLLEISDPLNLSLQHVALPQTISFAKQDYTYTHQFLYSYRGSEATFNAYRRELERLLHWSWLICKKSINELKRDDIEQFVEFCQHPPISWIGLQQHRRFINQAGQRIANPDWRPFVVNINKKARRYGTEVLAKNYTLSQSALQAIFSISGSFYEFLVQEEYCSFNPVAQIRQKSKFLRKKQHQRVIRRLSELQWTYVIETAEQLAAQDPDEHERTLFMMSILFGMYLRISELVASERWVPKMGDFFRDADGYWWFTTVGKGNKERQIVVSDAVLKALKRYRQFLNLPPLPSIDEQTSLIHKNRGQGAITSTRQIRKIVQFCFDASIMRLQTDGFHEDADRLLSATVHWLRHTGISEDVKYRPREHVRDDAGHSTSAITDKYIDVELRQRHASGKNKLIKLEE